MKDSQPSYLPNEAQLSKKPFAALPVDGQKLDAASRINFAKLYTVEHNVKVRNIGKIIPEHVPRLEKYYFDEHMGRGKTAASHSPERGLTMLPGAENAINQKMKDLSFSPNDEAPEETPVSEEEFTPDVSDQETEDWTMVLANQRSQAAGLDGLKGDANPQQSDKLLGESKDCTGSLSDSFQWLKFQVDNSPAPGYTIMGAPDIHETLDPSM